MMPDSPLCILYISGFEVPPQNIPTVEVKRASFIDSSMTTLRMFSL